MEVRAVDIRAPSEQTEGTRSQILRWLKRPGESVTENEPLIEIETDKVTVEVAAPASGILQEILKHEQEEIAPGELLGRLGSTVTASAGSTAALHAAHAEPGAGTGTDAATRPGVGGTAVAPPRSAARPAQPGAGSAPPAVRSPDRSPHAGSLSPAVRRLLTEHGLDAGAVEGTGPGGRITVEDVLRVTGAGAPVRRAPAAADASPAAAAAPEAEVPPAVPPLSGVTVEPPGAVRRVPHTAVRRRIAEHMVQSLLHTAPHVTTVFEVDLTAVLADRAAKREEFARHGVPLTLSAYFVQGAVAAIRAVPETNSRWTDSALEIYESIHIGIATAVEGTGLVVPVLRDAERRDLFDTARGLDDLVTRARAGKLSPAEVRGGTFTLSNHGVSGSLLAAPIIINQPQSAILGIGKLEKRAVVVEEGDEEKITVQPRCYVTLTLDHRVMDGHQANHFMQTLVQALTHWRA